MFEIIDAKKKLLDGIKPFPKDKMKNLKEYFDLQLTFNSNALEGSRLSLGEVKSILEMGIAHGRGKHLREYLEAAYHKEAIDYIESAARNGIDITEDNILELHYIIFENTGNDRAGKYRDVDVGNNMGKYSFADNSPVSNKINNLLSWYTTNREAIHPVELAAIFHCRLIYTYPFIYGNGRIGRLLMNLILIKAGYPQAVIKLEDKLKYEACMEKANIKREYKTWSGLLLKQLTGAWIFI